jgi:amino acid transporter
MNYLYWLGLLMFFTAGAVLHEVPWFKFMAAMLLIVFGTIFSILGREL